MKSKTVRFTLHGHLWRHHPQRIRSWETPWEEGCNIGDFLEQAGVPLDQVMVVMINGARRKQTDYPRGGDHLEVLPVVDGG
jgi:sulfur carrier protein ThiS